MFSGTRSYTLQMVAIQLQSAIDRFSQCSSKDETNKKKNTLNCCSSDWSVTILNCENDTQSNGQYVSFIHSIFFFFFALGMNFFFSFVPSLLLSLLCCRIKFPGMTELFWLLSLFLILFFFFVFISLLKLLLSSQPFECFFFHLFMPQCVSVYCANDERSVCFAYGIRNT